jgi:hypothetical protein
MSGNKLMKCGEDMDSNGARTSNKRDPARFRFYLIEVGVMDIGSCVM